ncbi:MAG TPA: aspartate-semialdehyde dehydrogenase [Flavobacteriales bacterium]|nr:aspartate-semialdehyde dehydrogenase [Flavobacteriales bacterium]
MKVAVVGATGLVGGVMLKVLEERQFPVSELLPVASERSAGRTITFKGMEVPLIGMTDAIAARPDLALFSAGGSTSLEWAPRFAEAGCIVVDNSSAWRMDPDKKLVVPEVNGEVLGSGDNIIANPNCSTIQLMVALAPLHAAYGVKRVIVNTYQAVTGTGMKAVHQLENERQGIEGEMAYPFPIDRNVIPRCDVFTDNGYTKEEMKLVNETMKILDPTIRVTATAVRVPVTGGHSEAVNVEFEREFEVNAVRDLLRQAPGVRVLDDPAHDSYPMPILAAGQDAVFVGRLRRDETQPCTLNLWIVADNLRKGAATNAVQIAELLLAKGLLKAR